MSDVTRLYLVDKEVIPLELLEEDCALLFEAGQGHIQVEKLIDEQDTRAPIAPA